MTGQLVDSPMPQLLQLSIVGCEVSSATIASIGSHCPSLGQLDLSRCSGIDSIDSAEWTRLRSLTRLILLQSHCSDTQLQLMNEVIPHVDIKVASSMSGASFISGLEDNGSPFFVEGLQAEQRSTDDDSLMF